MCWQRTRAPSWRWPSPPRNPCWHPPPGTRLCAPGTSSGATLLVSLCVCTSEQCRLFSIKQSSTQSHRDRMPHYAAHTKQAQNHTGIQAQPILVVMLTCPGHCNCRCPVCLWRLGQGLIKRMVHACSGKGGVEVLQHTHDVLAVAWAPSGKLLASATLDGQIYFWDPLEAQLLVQYPPSCSFPSSLFYSHP